MMDFRNDIWVVWDTCDIAVVPSTEPEPFGLVALEAMAAKKPVIAANCGGLKEIVIDQETGVLFEPRNSYALADAIEDLINNKEKRHRLGNNGFNRLNEKFSLSNYIFSIESIYKLLMKII